MAFAHKEEHLEELCGKLKEAVDCVNKFTRKCLDTHSKIQYEAMTNGTQTLIKDLCTKGSPFRQEYLKHAKCFHKYQHQYRMCSDRYFSYVDTFKDEDQTTQIKTWCWFVRSIYSKHSKQQ
ncbi:unnamed protein product [Medioppia subpectinata]|uniref:Uncharacterized protein n=1 Tax=Medioppia subpectinata TaxID=1979941 RepID=A0A7R9KQ00_9ACAR|nr:unnamed protein product [Medioppia subpectinata]CAG2107665.1 unnamed protein product [Medioppia subpectinata]